MNRTPTPAILTTDESALPAFAERRQEPRVATNTPARLFFGSSLDRWVDCVLKDRSAHGMKVYVPAIVQLPTFVVVLDFAGEAAFHAQRRWQKGDMAGLRLTAPIDLQSNQDRSVEVVREAWRSLRSGLNPSAPPTGPRDPNLIG